MPVTERPVKMLLWAHSWASGCRRMWKGIWPDSITPSRAGKPTCFLYALTCNVESLVAVICRSHFLMLGGTQDFPRQGQTDLRNFIGIRQVNIVQNLPYHRTRGVRLG